MYDLHDNPKSGTPMGLVYIPVFRNKNFEKKYTKKKWEQVDGLLKGEDISGLVDARFRIAKALGKNKVFKEAPNNKIRMAVARKYCPFGIPDSAIKEIMNLAKLPEEQLEAIMEMEKDSDIEGITEKDLGYSDDDYM